MQDRVLIKEIQPPETTKGGLILPSSARDRSLMRGVVLKLGTPSVDYNLTLAGIKIGSKILFVEYSSSEVELGGEKFRFIRYEDIIGTYDEDNDHDL